MARTGIKAGKTSPIDEWPHQTGKPVRACIEGTRLELIQSGKARLQAILSLIGGAQDTVRLLFYMFNSDETGTLVRDALVAAAKRGVKVQLLLDSYGSTADADFFQPLDQSGGNLCLFHPTYGRRYLLRNHQKLVIADERRALIGGANIHNSYVEDRGEGHWRDLWLALDGPAVAHAVKYYDSLYRWTTKKGAKLKSLRRLIAEDTQWRGALQWKFSGPVRLRNPWPWSLAKDICSGRRVDIIAAYFSPPRAMLRRLCDSARLGPVRVITAAKSDNNATIGAARHTYRRLLRRGVEMYEYQPAKLHTKLAVIDNVVHIGSANFDFRSLYLNLEIMLRIDDERFANAMRDYFENELKHSEQITPELHRKRATLWRRFRWTLSHWLVTSMDYTVTRRLNFGLEA